MRFHVMTLFPELVEGVLSSSIVGRGQKAGAFSLDCRHIREFSKDKHRNTDDSPFGGGFGLVMTCQPIYDCAQAIFADIPEGVKKRVIYLSPKGRIFNHEKAKELSEYDDLIFLCGHYEGVDQRVLDEIVDEEISIGDYVVTGGEIPACIVMDAVARLLPGVLADPECYEDESIATGILEYPQYTKPRLWNGREVPEILLSGDHGKIKLWRTAEAVKITRERRPDLLARHPEYEEMLKPKVKKSSGHRKSKQKLENSEKNPENAAEIEAEAPILRIDPKE